MIEKFDTKKISNLAKELIKQGKQKQEVYEELVNEYKYRNQIADIVRYSPSIEKQKKYLIWNTIYLIFLSLITLLSLLNPTLGIIWLVLLVAIVALKKFKYYYWNTILGVITIISVIGLAFYHGANDGFESVVLLISVSLPLALILIIGGVYLPKKLTPKYTERKEKYKDRNGKERIRIVHLFEE
jgi:phosphate/sulfate permease